MVRRKTRKKNVERDKLIRLGVLAVTACALAVGVVFGLWRLWQAVTRMDAFIVRADEPILGTDWVRPEAARRDFLETDTTGALSTPCSIFASDLAGRVADAYALSPWVRRVKAVRKVFPNRLDIELEVREPFALVRAGSNTYCVDEDGMVLDPAIYDLSWKRLSALQPQVVVIGKTSTPLERRLWTDVSVQGGLAMVRLCREQFAAKVKIRRVEVRAGRKADGTPLAMAWLVLDKGPRVRWGHVPIGVGSPGEVATPDKAAAFRAVIEKEGANLARFRAIDLRWSQPVCEQ